MCSSPPLQYGPTVSSAPKALVPFLEEYQKKLVFEFTGEAPALFHVGSDYQRAVASNQWTQLVKSAFKRCGGQPCPPKMLRSSFITYMRQHPDADPELFAAASRAMRHAVDTQASDVYDKAGAALARSSERGGRALTASPLRLPAQCTTS